jgi:hypothetical protein
MAAVPKLLSVTFFPFLQNPSVNFLGERFCLLLNANATARMLTKRFCKKQMQLRLAKRRSVWQPFFLTFLVAWWSPYSLLPFVDLYTTQMQLRLAKRRSVRTEANKLTPELNCLSCSWFQCIREKRTSAEAACPQLQCLFFMFQFFETQGQRTSI